ncbi:Uncharacterised protein [Mycobacteroides abscessus subsp. abscessus]|nr:Uncharacterised protein [Mycobacteroides abscessus subsp. abscessus]
MSRKRLSNGNSSSSTHAGRSAIVMGGYTNPIVRAIARNNTN